jgi:hypothetical protein
MTYWQASGYFEKKETIAKGHYGASRFVITALPA